ncbi:transketolase [Pacificispira sp.]|uniref:transketolase n=1 Tax=Pacificispira sp. TaxID=2888761 RepID=UPI003B51B794
MTATARPMLLNDFDAAASRKRCMGFRRRILDVSQTVTALHIAPAFSCMEIADTVYNGLMQRKDDGSSDDVFLMSKGHGCMAQYAILEYLGVLANGELDRYCTAHGELGAHPDYGVPGIEASTGSLGHGLAMAVGMAIAERNKKSGATVYAILSDGEIQEGSTWEAIMMASSLGLTNLVMLVDNNNFQSLGQTHLTHPSFYPLDDKFRAFQWECETVNGHDAAAIFQAVTSREGKGPFALVCKTTKGKGVSYMEGVPIWHYRSPNPEEYKTALDELTEISG